MFDYLLKFLSVDFEEQKEFPPELLKLDLDQYLNKKSLIIKLGLRKPLEIPDSKLEKYFRIAAEFGNLEFLIKYLPKYNRRTFIVEKFLNYEVVKFLLNNGFVLEKAEKFLSFEETDQELLKLLVLRKVLPSNKQLLQVFAFKGYFKLVKLLIDQFKVPFDREIVLLTLDVSSKGPLELKRHLDLIKYFIEQKKFIPDEFFIEEAACNSSPEVLEYFLNLLKPSSLRFETLANLIKSGNLVNFKYLYKNNYFRMEERLVQFAIFEKKLEFLLEHQDRPKD